MSYTFSDCMSAAQCVRCHRPYCRFAYEQYKQTDLKVHVQSSITKVCQPLLLPCLGLAKHKVKLSLT